MKWNIPNILTTLRLLAAPGVAVMFLYFVRPWADWFAMLLFVGAAITDYFDGYLARLWKQESRFGAMLDPIADKAMVIIALLVNTGFSGMNPWILLPATVIMFREIFVSGLREFLQEKSSTLKVTNLAKYKTFAQMIALTFLFATGIFEHNFLDRTIGMDEGTLHLIMTGQLPDDIGLVWHQTGAWWSWWIGTILLWIAAALTLITGVDYFAKSLPFFREEEGTHD
ncbi:CDP-diacylglycerol--glycerol-3-phosphate 3-phosphatidyltransferase [Candidatus Rhodobacter oscarellae]|uniref:CDP-diacylglycerol--glycerol-3-phosphate 3-phosphatidyltransferase n=1 Tax=Candidatus Rhodobacter oscarellae TaxID=1675527 RepID=A0A0J9E0R8_9RHOB|nr:CDP-diacylglycerol--glycerol-3-phosphate 3-phosphatidyltransferase [Candidatus Rhodobacter lobularis]KMW56257.1 CDP-diacylglycerol--glycerol-3-phosphate 3-phosphatidyltransferase [Candidatus Rhodobacter lobularis]